MMPRSSHVVSVLALALISGGCASIPGPAVRHILMFDGDGHPVDPTGNLGCRERPLVQSLLCHETAPQPLRDVHLKIRDHPRLADEYYKQHYLKLLLGCMDAYFVRTSPDDCTPHLASPADEKRKVLIFVHGGLNTQVASLERVSAAGDGRGPMYREIADAGFYPIFINWQSSLFSSYYEQLMYIRQGQKLRRFGPVTAPVTFGVDVARSLARAPLVWAAQTTNDLATAPGFTPPDRADADEISKHLICQYQFADSTECHNEFRFKPPPLCFPVTKKYEGRRNFGKPALNTAPNVFRISVGSDERNCAEMDAAFLTYTLTIPTRLLSTPIVDTFGTSAWDNMLRRVHMLFNLDEEFEVADHWLRRRSDLADKYREEYPKDEGVGEIPRSGGVSVFLSEFSQYIATHPGDWEITLVGHSMGTIVANQMLREAREQHLHFPVKNIVYLAAAASIRDFQDSVLPRMWHDPDVRFFNIMLHPTAEEREPYYLGGLQIDPGPRGSLLVLIDNFLAKPLTYLDRTAGRYENFLRAMHAIPPELRGRIHVKTFDAGIAVRATNPQRHGEVGSRFRFWRPKCWQPEPAMQEDQVAPEACVYGR